MLGLGRRACGHHISSACLKLRSQTAQISGHASTTWPTSSGQPHTQHPHPPTNPRSLDPTAAPSSASATTSPAYSANNTHPTYTPPPPTQRARHLVQNRCEYVETRGRWLVLFPFSLCFSAVWCPSGPESFGLDQSFGFGFASAGWVAPARPNVKYSIEERRSVYVRLLID